MDSIPTVIAIVAVAVGLPGLAGATHLGLLALASLLYRGAEGEPDAPIRFLVLVPAHNEELVIGRCLEAIAAERRPGDQVMVVADRCTDATAEIARGHGAIVVERGPGDEPGRAAARQAGLERARELEWDAIAMLDADSVISPGYFEACERALASGAGAVQARSESEPGETLPTEASLVARMIQGVTLPRGKDRLGLSVRLSGTGMATWRHTIYSHDFHAPASEDLFFTMELALDGVHGRHVDDARLVSQGAHSWGEFGGQKMRYEAGRMAAAKTFVPPLLARAFRKRDPAAFEAAVYLATPPFALAVLSTLLGLGLGAAVQAWTIAAVFGGAFLVLALVLVTGMIQARATLRTWLSLVVAPWYLAWKTVVHLRALASVMRGDDYYPPTARV
jgi:cellulose synthase/poly-beta-1,6-N-acetylglucosamine synthase-like glycosyltransferase